MELTKNELKGVNGGALSLKAGLIIGATISFLIGVVDGYLRPLKCNR